MEKYIVLLALLVMPVNAAIYKWTDKDGNVHFGDRPVNQDVATELNIKTNTNTGITNSSGNKQERDYLLKKIEEEKVANAEKRKKKTAEAKKHRKLCDSYRRRLQLHLQTNRTFITSPDGERTYLTEEQRAAKKKNLSSNVKKYCR